VTDEDPTEVTLLSPSIMVDKDDADDTDDTQVVAPDGTTTFTITVTNNGNADLIDVVLTDALAPVCDRDATQTASLISVI